MAKLTMQARKALPSRDFALPGRGKGPSGKGSGSYPIPDASHARNALARSSGKPVAAAVRAKVKAKFPGIVSHMPRGGTLSPRGDIGKLRHAEKVSVFSRSINNDGRPIVASAFLPVRPFKKAGGDNS